MVVTASVVVVAGTVVVVSSGMLSPTTNIVCVGEDVPASVMAATVIE